MTQPSAATAATVLPVVLQAPELQLARSPDGDEQSAPVPASAGPGTPLKSYRLRGKQPARRAGGSRIKRRRLCGKQPAPREGCSEGRGVADGALAAEAWTEVVALSEDAQRQHVHYTHVRTFKAGDRQPSSFTRAEFWEHMERVYREVYPWPANPAGSILLFGTVAKERHAEHKDLEHREEHHHAATYCCKRHYWNKVARHSYSVYKVKLNAVAHDGYFSMYSYVTRESAKKPLSELDQELFLSSLHPRGDDLRKLLELGAVHARAVGGRSAKNAPGKDKGKRVRSGDIYELVSSKKVGSALELQALACAEAAKGDTRLAHFCTSMGAEKVGQLVRSAASVLEAPAALRACQASRMDLLRDAASQKPCICNGKWIRGALMVLENNRENVNAFCRDVCKALEVGALRGTNIAIVGEPGCGKSMLFEPFGDIFKVMGKPQKKSSFSLTNALDAHILLWQDYKHHEETVGFEDLLSLIVGEQVEVRVPHQANTPFRNKAPLFYTSNSMLRVTREDPQETAKLNAAMHERFCYREWRTPIPHWMRQSDFPRCARCCAQFYLTYR